MSGRQLWTVYRFVIQSPDEPVPRRDKTGRWEALMVVTGDEAAAEQLSAALSRLERKPVRAARGASWPDESPWFAWKDRDVWGRFAKIRGLTTLPDRGTVEALTGGNDDRPVHQDRDSV